MPPNILAPLVRKLESRAVLDEEDRAAILALPYRLQVTEREAYLVREGEQPERACLLLSGFAFRQKITSQGMRQIISLHIPGDFVDLQGVLLNLSDHNVQALTRCEFAVVARADIRALARVRPTVGLAMWTDTLIDASIFREWVVNVGRRDAMTRIAHLLCEVARRMEAAGLADRLRYEMPMSQEQLADATGLTPVHVNRMLRDLDRSELIVRNHRTIVIKDWKGLSELADFNENYLHLDQLAVEIARADAVPAGVRSS